LNEHASSNINKRGTWVVTAIECFLFKIGDEIGRGRGKKIIKEIIPLSNGWFLLKTTNGKGPGDFRVRTVYQTAPTIRYITPKHAHFVIDFYGKLNANKADAMKLFSAIVDTWKGNDAAAVLQGVRDEIGKLPGYDPEYILYALNWILQQEDINYRTPRPSRKQEEINEILGKSGVPVLESRAGSQLAMSLICNVAQGTHPVEAFIKASLDVLPIKRSFGAK
jgi:hypothetical protein